MKFNLHFFLILLLSIEISYAQIGFNEHFIATYSSNLINTATDLLVADIDGDGVDDVISVSIDYDNKIAWYKNIQW